MSKHATGGSETDSGILVDGVSKRFGNGSMILDQISLEVQPGEFVCFLGPSGCGKTTLLRAIAGLDRPDAGRIVVGRRTVMDIEKRILVPPEKRGLGLVSQHYALWPHMTVGQNIEYPLKRRKIARDDRLRRVREVSEFVGLNIPLDRYPAQLSGGQQQRVALARALVFEPPALLLDEPLSNLDAGLRNRLRKEVRLLHERLGTTTILVTHDQDEAVVMADRIAVMHNGTVSELGTPSDVLERPSKISTAEFVGFENFLGGDIISRDGEQAMVSIGAGDDRVEIGTVYRGNASQGPVKVAVRAEGMRIIPEEFAVPGRSLRGIVKSVTRMRNVSETEITWNGREVMLRQPTETLSDQVSPGSTVWVNPDPARAIAL